MKADRDLLSQLMGLACGSFFKELWCKTPYVQANGASQFAEACVGLEDVDGLIASLPLPSEGWMSLIEGAARQPGPEFKGADGLFDLAAIHRAYRAGASLVLTRMHKRHQSIGRFCRQLEAEFVQAGLPLRERIGANLYLTPPNAQALDPHLDFHHVLVIQLEGSKHWGVWPIHEAVNDAHHSGGLGDVALGQPSHSPTLNPGDVLYIPRGCPHEARTGEGYSLHLTLSITPITWLDLVEAAIVDVPGIRDTIPTESNIHDQANGLVDQLGTHLRTRLPNLYAECMASFVLNLARLPGNGFSQQLVQVTLDSVLHLTPGLLPLLRKEGKWLHLIAQGVRLSMPLQAEAALEQILAGVPFSPNDLSGLMPDQALALTQTLLEQGCVCSAAIH